MKRFKWISVTVISAALLAPGSALAQGAAGDQYTEQIPKAGNDSGFDGVTGGGGGNAGSAPNGTPDGGSDDETSTGGASAGEGTSSGGPAISSNTANKFEKDPDGAAAAGLAQSTAPDSEALRDAAAQAQAGVDDTSSTTFGSTTAGEDGGPGVGLVILAIVLAATAALGAIYWLWRRRRDRSPRTGEGSPSTA